MENEYEEDDEIESSCYYCGNTKKHSLLICCNHGCEEYFCNDVSVHDGSGSHIFQHLINRSHNIITTSSDFEIVCFMCGENNIFSLCYQLTDNEITIICRTKCLVDQIELRSLPWKSVISEKAISSDLIPSEISLKHISAEEIQGLESKLSKGEIKNRLDIGPNTFHKISLRYNKYEDYKKTFEDLIELEHEYDKYYSEIESSQTVIPNWETGFRKFSYRITEEKCHFKPKDEVCVMGTNFKADGMVSSVSQGTITVDLLKEKAGNALLTSLKIKAIYSDVVYERMKRGLKSFRSIDLDFKNVILGYKNPLIDFDLPDISNFSAPGLPPLNQSQTEAVKIALQKKLCLIQGPPGTGKTVTTATIVYHLSKLMNRPSQYELTVKNLQQCEKDRAKNLDDRSILNRELKLRMKLCESSLKFSSDCAIETKFESFINEVQKLISEKELEDESLMKSQRQLEVKLEKVKPTTSRKLVLVCAPSNVAVDHLVQKITSTGLRVIRFYSKSREEILSEISHLSYHNIFMERLNLPENSVLKDLFIRKKNQELDKASKSKCSELEYKLRDKILENVDVICCTCIGAMDHRLANLSFDKVIVDEACQAQEPETILPLLYKPDQIILVGDHFQLGPIIKCKEAEKAGLENSMFRRLIDLGFEPYMLNRQYRMHPAISAFPSFSFYNNLLENGVGKIERTDSSSCFNWPGGVPTFFYHINSQEEHSSTGKSFVNREEANSVVEIIRNLGPSSEIGVITFYDAQKVTICNYTKGLDERGYKLEIASVDSFQGREKDYIILSCVRSNQRSGVGFLGNYRRLNVAITRAKFGLIICGNADTLSKSPVWNSLIKFYSSHNLVFTGRLDSLNTYDVKTREIEFTQFDLAFPYAPNENFTEVSE